MADTDDAAVLVVDDSLDIRQIETVVLELKGYRVLTAADGREALVVLRRERERIKAVVLDLMMPRFDGWHFLREKAQDPSIADVPVVVVSAVANGRRPPMPAPIRATLLKPIDFEALTETVARVMSEA